MQRIVVFHLIFWAIHLALFIFGFLKQKNDPELSFLNQIGNSVYISRGAGLVLALDCAALLLGVCRNVIRVLRGSFFNRYIPFDENLYFHRWTAYSMLLFTLIHTNAHYTNFFLVEYLPAISNVLHLEATDVHFKTFGGTTGHIMLLICFLMFTSAKREVKTKNFEIFWYTHHLFVPFYICLFLHSAGCFVKSTQTKQCKGYNSNYYTLPVFFLYIGERILREYRSRQKTTVNKIIFHPGNTVEIRFEKPGFSYKPGQYLFLNIPAISRFQWHPFTISSSPEEGFISVHIRIVGDWTKQAATLFGCFNDGRSKQEPQIRIDGPYGAPAEDLYNYKAAILVGTGIGVTPAASLLKSIWFKFYRKSPMELEKTYFFWINRDTDSFSWFQSLFASLEETVPSSQLEIHTYLTGKQNIDDIHNICINDSLNFDPVTELQTRNHYGRPDWGRIFKSIRSQSSYSASRGKLKIGVFFCGPKGFAKTLLTECIANSDDQVEFELRKEHF